MVSGTASVPKGLTRVFDKYMLPKVAFTVVTLASMTGALLTGLRHGWADWIPLVLRWATYWTLALLLGTEMWKIFYLRPSVKMRPEPDAVDYGAAMIRLHRAWQRSLAPAATILVAWDMSLYTGHHGTAASWAAAGGISLAIALVGIIAGNFGPVKVDSQDTASWITLVGLAGTVALLAGMDVTIESGPGSWLLVANRILHLWAFSAWLGGALWNIFIAVPAGMQRVNMDTVILANFQLERFRVVVRTVFPTIITTGLIQAWVIFHWHWQGLFANTLGYLVLAKIGFILTLVGVFIACPMWRACSPIRGVCDLDDLE